MWIIGLIVSIVLGVLALLLAVGLAGRLVLRSLRGPLEARIAAHYGPGEVLMKDLTANSFGLESRGVWQGRGNGALVLTKDCLHFFRFMSGGDVRVPLKAITDVSFTKRHLGKATIYDLLKVRFTADGQPDSIAWYLTDPRAWKDQLEGLRTQAPAPG